MDFYKSVLCRWFPFPSVNHNDCYGDGFLCVFSLDVEVVGEGAAVYLFGQAATVLRTEAKPNSLGKGTCCQCPSVSRSMVYSCP